MKLCPSPDGDEETFILCRSRDRLEKEKAIFAGFESRIEEGLSKIKSSCEKKKQSPVKIAERVGRLKGANSRAARLFDVKVEEDQQFPVSFQRASIDSSCIVDHGRQIAIEPMKWTS